MVIIISVLFIGSVAFLVLADIHRLIYLARIRDRNLDRIQNDLTAMRRIAVIYALAGLSFSGFLFLGIFLDKKGAFIKTPEDIFSTQIVPVVCLIASVLMIGGPIIGYIRFKWDILLARNRLEK